MKQLTAIKEQHEQSKIAMLNQQQTLMNQTGMMRKKSGSSSKWIHHSPTQSKKAISMRSVGSRKTPQGSIGSPSGPKTMQRSEDELNFSQSDFLT